jgi:hypothetical protein
MFLFGNRVNGGILGRNPEIPVSTTYEDNLPLEFDFRSVYASVLQQWFNIPENDIRDVLFKEFEYLPVIEGSVIASNPFREIVKDDIQLYPNPATDRSTLSLNSDGSETVVQVISLQGRVLRTAFAGKPERGRRNIEIDLSGLSQGNYFIMVQDKKGRRSLPIIKY